MKSKKHYCPECIEKRPVFYVRVTDEVAEGICRVCGSMLWLEPIKHIPEEVIYEKGQVKLMGRLF
jgi:hypothetical protein